MDDVLDSTIGQIAIRGIAIMTIIIGVFITIALIFSVPGVIAYGIYMSMPFWTIVGYAVLTAIFAALVTPPVVAITSVPIAALED